MPRTELPHVCDSRDLNGALVIRTTLHLDLISLISLISLRGFSVCQSGWKKTLTSAPLTMNHQLTLTGVDSTETKD